VTAPAQPRDPLAAPSLAVVGGGQLARMMAQAAVPLGVRLRLLAEGPDVSAAQVVRDPTVGDYRDLATLRGVADGCDVVTFDHEHVPTEHLRTLTGEGHACRPGPDALVHAQDKSVMRERLDELEVPSPRHRVVADRDEAVAFAESGGGFPVVLKTTRGGYDGKGVWVVSSPEECADAFAVAASTGVAILAEEKVDFRRELSALVARSPSGQVAAYPVVESEQRDGVCWEVTAPAPGLDPKLAVAAQRIAMRVSAELDVTGILAVELFENHLRAVLDLPLGSPEARARWTVMVNILGGGHGALSEDLYGGYPHVFARDPRLKVHLYGKEVRPGRKVGHVTAFGDDLDDVRERARHAAAWFRGDLGMESR
jgi:5-(carboxyamino)imidazole ribonucleotide synthase